MGGSENFLDTRKGGSEKVVGLGRGGGIAPKICILQNQHDGGMRGGLLKKSNH